MVTPIEDSTKELKMMYRILAADVETARQYGQADPSPFAHRTLFRTYFALIEGLSHQFRLVAIACGEQCPGLLSAQELTLLRQEKYGLNSKGAPEVLANFQRALPSLLFSMRCYAKVHGAVFEPDTNNSGWRSFREFVKIRNGLEHPKSASDLELKQSQIHYAVEAAAWWKSAVLELLRVCREADEHWRSKLS